MTALTLDCPGCGYALDGLSGTLVTCPECGRTWDPAALGTWMRRDWFRNDEYRRLSKPAFQGPLLAVLVTVAGVFATTNRSTIIALMGVVVAIWAWFVFVAVRRGAVAQGLRLVAALHVVHLGFLLGWILLIGGLAGSVAVAFDAVFGTLEWGSVVQVVKLWGLAIAGLVAQPLCYRLDRRVGRACVRRWFTMHTRVDRATGIDSDHGAVAATVRSAASRTR